jgi:hypothetical protein
VVRFARLIIGTAAFLADLRSAPPGVVQVDGMVCLPIPRAGSGLQLFIPATGSSLQVFILAGLAATEITRTG